VGFCVPGKLHEEFAARKCQQDLHSSVVSEVALREFLRAGEMEKHLKTLHARNQGRRQLALATIAKAFPAGTEVSPPRGGYMLWARLPHRVDLAVVRQQARERHVVFASGSVFYPAPPDQSCMRLNCAKASETELVEGLEILGEILRNAPPA
jgi:DNA-binding transcriptional MocR family regulator